MPPESLIIRPTAWDEQRALNYLCDRDRSFAKSCVRNFEDTWRIGGASKGDLQRAFTTWLRAENEITLSACAEKGSDDVSLRATPCQNASQKPQ